MAKENLVLLQSFPTNSIMLRGFIEYLSDYYNVYFIDLPGFIKSTPPLERITFEGYCDYVASKIKALNLDGYLAEGISFGFAIMNQLEHDQQCKGIIALEPFIGSQSLNYGPIKKGLLSILIQIVCSLKLYSLFWGSPLVAKYLPKLMHYPPEMVNVLFDQIDARSFFETANIILKDDRTYRFHHLPYVLIANKHDRTVNFGYIYATLSQNVTRLLVLNIEIDHYPSDTSKAYFQKMVPAEMIQQISAFFAENPV
jgi:pimeloyl-ACP methyl ester carboxylesterase